MSRDDAGGFLERSENATRKLGKKIDLGSKLTNEDILESHLKMMRDKHVRHKNAKDQKL